MVQWIGFLHSLLHVFSSSSFVYNSENYWKSIAFLGLLECFVLSLLYLLIKYLSRRMDKSDDDDDENPLLSSSTPHSPRARLLRLQQQLNSFPQLLGIIAVCLLVVAAFACQGVDNFRLTTTAMIKAAAELLDTAQANGGSGDDLSSISNVLKHFQVYMPVILLVVVPPLALCVIASISGAISFFTPYRIGVVRASVSSSFLGFIWLSFVHGAELSAIVSIADFCHSLQSNELFPTTSSSSSTTSTSNSTLTSSVQNEVLNGMLDAYVCTGAGSNLVNTWVLELGALIALAAMCILSKGVLVDTHKQLMSPQLWHYGSSTAPRRHGNGNNDEHLSE
eukprot:c5713_g1_i1.p1 GENE.c5713_g1_i1~~c5713_g1_i1.p1  ORF type:complete len:336 (+),score=101.96 c5713_g1_i1:286-1293(+)